MTTPNLWRCALALLALLAAACGTDVEQVNDSASTTVASESGARSFVDLVAEVEAGGSHLPEIEGLAPEVFAGGFLAEQGLSADGFLALLRYESGNDECAVLNLALTWLQGPVVFSSTWTEWVGRQRRLAELTIAERAGGIDEAERDDLLAMAIFFGRLHDDLEELTVRGGSNSAARVELFDRGERYWFESLDGPFRDLCEQGQYRAILEAEFFG